jgi:hypothetical protein
MKNKGLTIAIILFFLLLNTSYFWEGKLGFFAFLVFLIFIVFYIGMLILFFFQLFYAIRERFNNKYRFLILGLLTFILPLTYLKPHGFINFDKLQGSDLLVAYAEGGGNCSTTLKFKENQRFIERSVCFGIDEDKGTYLLKDDTIFIKSKNYKYAIINKDTMNNYYLKVYHSFTDTTSLEIGVTKNELYNINK